MKPHSALYHYFLTIKHFVMKERNGKFNLGNELSRSEQKKVMGGIYMYCTDRPGQAYILGGTCQEQAGYCQGAGHGSMISCSGGS